MKSILTAIILFVSTMIGTATGAFYIDNDVECTFFGTSGPIATKQLDAGLTYEINITNGIMDFHFGNTNGPITFFFPAGSLISADCSTDMSIMDCFQNIENISSNACKAIVAGQSAQLAFSKGEFSIVYYPQNTNTSLNLLNIHTPFADYELETGKYLFRVSDKSVVAYVAEGQMKVHGDTNKVDVVTKGNLSFAVPFKDEVSGVTDKIISSVRRSKPDEVEKLTTSILALEKRTNEIFWAVVEHKLVGISLK